MLFYPEGFLCPHVLKIAQDFTNQSEASRNKLKIASCRSETKWSMKKLEIRGFSSFCVGLSVLGSFHHRNLNLQFLPLSEKSERRLLRSLLGRLNSLRLFMKVTLGHAG